MKVIGVIPARWGSTRFEGKILAELAGKPMIQHVWERASQSRMLEECVIACDDERILIAAQHFGARAFLTSPDHPSGTDRVAEVVEALECDIVVNIQGDEPLIDPTVINDLANVLVQDESSSMATVIKVIEEADDLNNPNVVKVVVDAHKNALYFSRAKIPYDQDDQNVMCYKHLGLYAYRRDFLLKLKKLPLSFLEKAEKLEQLRVLEAGFKIKTVLTNVETIGVDTPEDLKRVKLLLRGGLFTSTKC